MAYAPPAPFGGPELEPGGTGGTAGGHAPAAGDAADRHVRAGRADVRVVLPDARVLGAGARRVQADVLQRQAEQVRRVVALEHGLRAGRGTDRLQAVDHDVGVVRGGRAVAARVERVELHRVLDAGQAGVVVGHAVDRAALARAGLDPEIGRASC